MGRTVGLLSYEHRVELCSLLRTRLEANVFLLGVLSEDTLLPGTKSISSGVFYGLEDRRGLQAILYSTEGGLLVPFGRTTSAVEELGRKLRAEISPRMAVGPRDLVDALWAGLAPPYELRLSRRHRLYTLRRGQLLVAPDPKVRVALPRDLEVAVDQAAQMQAEELGIDPRAVDAARFRRRMARLIYDGLLWVLPAGDYIGFQASAGSCFEDGTQIEAVYVPEILRRRGFATRGMAGMCSHLLQEYPLITLHVNEENEQAMRLYERLGFRASMPFRLLAC